MSDKPCKDCVAESIATHRPAPHPGPRCTTHHRKFKKEQKTRNHDTMVARTYEMEPGDYERLYEHQGGKCAICQVATGKTRRLAVDHDHETNAVRGLLCSPCNYQVIGRLGAPALARAILYLSNPPYRQMKDPRTYDNPGPRGIENPQ